MHIFLLRHAFRLNLVFKFGDFVQRRVKSRAGEPLICGERGEGGSQLLSTSKIFALVIIIVVIDFFIIVIIIVVIDFFIIVGALSTSKLFI